MSESPKTPGRLPSQLWRNALAAALIWTTFVFAMISWNVFENRHEILDDALHDAQISFPREMLLHLWKAGRGGGDAPATNHAPPSPRLSRAEEHAPVIPSAMLQQMQGHGQEQFEYRSHLTALKPSRPETTPDAWETGALKTFEQGATEVSSVEMIDGHEYMRVMRPLVVEASCLACHSAQDDKVGNIRGGMSVSVPLAPLRTHAQSYLASLAIGHGVIWLLGLGVIGFSARRVQQHSTESKRAEEVMRAERQRFSDVLDQLPAYLALISPDYHVSFANRFFRERFGESRGRHCYEYLFNRTEPCETCETFCVFKTKAPHQWEWTGPDGRNYDIHDFPFKDTDGSTLIMEVGFDITERKRAEAALRQSERKYRTLLENLPQRIFLKDRHSVYVSCNHHYTHDLGTHPDALAGKTDFDFHPRELAEKYRADDQRVMQSGVTEEMEEPFVRDGKRYWIHTVKTPVFNEAGECTGILGIFSDITEREEERQRLIAAIEQANDSIVITDPNGVIRYVNPVFERISGYTKPEAIGQNPRILKSGKQDVAFYRGMWKTLRRGEVWHGHFINKKKDGTLYEEDASISPVRDAAGNIVNYVAVKHDVTHEAHLEVQLRQAQKMENIGRLAGGVAHDFNNLLMAIMGYSDMTLKALPADDPSRKHIEQIRVAGERAAGLTRQLLAFSRKQVLLPRMLDLNDLAANLIKMLRQLIGEDIRLTTTFDPTLGRVMADHGQIEQVITNLAVNARDAMPEGGMLTIQTANAELDEAYASQYEEVTPGRYVLLTVSDTGTGMTDEIKAHLFEPFFTTKEQGKGTGLGLPTVFGIVKQSGGHITVDSEVGHGTTFKIYLPRVEETAKVAFPHGAPVESPRGTETILLVEDEDQVRNLARMALEECGYTVLVAANGPDAIQLAKQHEGKIQMLITDMIMPEMSGRVLAPLLITLNPGIKVLYMSGYTDTAIVRQDLLAAGSAFLQKPFSLDVLAHKVREVLDAQPDREQTPRKSL